MNVCRVFMSVCVYKYCGIFVFFFQPLFDLKVSFTLFNYLMSLGIMSWSTPFGYYIILQFQDECFLI